MISGMIEVGPLMSENQVEKSQFSVMSPLLPQLRGRGVIDLVVSESRFRRFWKNIRLKMYLHSIVLA